MPRCPHCRKPLAEPVGDCPHCGHDLDKHAWLLGSVEPGRARRGCAWAGLAAVAAMLILLLAQLR